jgi:hypothetical protein
MLLKMTVRLLQLIATLLVDDTDLSLVQLAVIYV